MKSTLLFKNVSWSLVLVILSFCMISCTRCTEPPKEPPVSDSYKRKLISYEESQVLFDEYTMTNNEILTKYRNGEPDSRWYWFSVEDLEGYIKYVKENAKQNNRKNPGIRIYMGKYPLNQPKNKMAKPEYAGYQTIFLVPTYKKSGNDTINVMSRKTDSDENTDETSMQALNMTNLAPPPKTLTGTMQSN